MDACDETTSAINGRWRAHWLDAEDRAANDRTAVDARREGRLGSCAWKAIGGESHTPIKKRRVTARPREFSGEVGGVGIVSSRRNLLYGQKLDSSI